MSFFRMLAIDLDGTLLSADGKVSPRNRAAIQRALQAGVVVCFATGRNLTECQAVLQQVGHHDIAVFVGGAMVIDTRTGATLHRTTMHPDLAREACGLFESLGHAALALQDTSTAGIDYLVTRSIPLNHATRQWMDITAAAVHPVPTLADAPHEHTVRVGICSDADEARRVQKRVREALGQRAVCHSLYVAAYGVEVIEVFDPAVNKWSGVMHVARRHGIRPEQIVAIGDDVNDIPMIAGSGLGVAMGNARPEAIAAADRVIGRNDQDGLAAFIEELLDAASTAPAEAQAR